MKSRHLLRADLLLNAFGRNRNPRQMPKSGMRQRLLPHLEI